jgi:hypothetical protein
MATSPSASLREAEEVMLRLAQDHQAMESFNTVRGSALGQRSIVFY